MKSLLKTYISLNSPTTNHNKSTTFKSVSRITLIFLFISLTVIYYKSYNIFNYIAVILTVHTVIIMILQIKSFISNLINELLEGLGGFNNTLIPNEELSESLTRELEEGKFLREQEEIRAWKERIKQENIENRIEKFLSRNIEKICITSLLFHSYLIINSEYFPILCLLFSNNFTEISVATAIPFWVTEKYKNYPRKKTFIDHIVKKEITNKPLTTEDLTLALLETLKIKGLKRRKRIIENTTIIYNQICVHYGIFPSREDKEFERVLFSLTDPQIDELLNDFMSDIGSHRIKNLVFNIENQNLRKHLIRSIYKKYETLINSELDRKELILELKKELASNYTNHSHTINKNITPLSRKYYTSAGESDNFNKTNWTKLSLWTILTVRLLARIIFYMFIFNNTLYPSPLHFILPIPFEDQLTEALIAAQDEEQDAYHEAAEIEAVWQNTEEELQDIAYFTGQTLAQVTQQYLNEN
jgi:hypothetical protein